MFNNRKILIIDELDHFITKMNVYVVEIKSKIGSGKVWFYSKKRGSGIWARQSLGQWESAEKPGIIPVIGDPPPFKMVMNYNIFKKLF